MPGRCPANALLGSGLEFVAAGLAKGLAAALPGPDLQPVDHKTSALTSTHRQIIRRTGIMQHMNCG